MALVEKFHVVAAERTVHANETIREGQIVSLEETAGEVVLQGSTYKYPYGIAGDTKSTTASSMPGIASGWQNRVSDYFDETRASAKMTVYHSGGEFATDQFSSNVASSTPLTLLFARNGLLDTLDQDGLSNVAAGATIVALLTQAAGAYPSGVPGTDINGDIALGGTNNGVAVGSGSPYLIEDQYIEFKLLI